MNPIDFNGKFCFSFNTHDMNPIKFNGKFCISYDMKLNSDKKTYSN